MSETKAKKQRKLEELEEREFLDQLHNRAVGLRAIKLYLKNRKNLKTVLGEDGIKRANELVERFEPNGKSPGNPLALQKNLAELFRTKLAQVV